MDSKTETVSDNKLIAEFLGLEKSKSIWDQGQHAYTMKFASVFNKMIVPSEMLFDCSWDWLMPVVIKCKSLAKGKTLDILPSIYNDILNALTDCNINLVHRQVLKFIHFYNSQSPDTIK